MILPRSSVLQIAAGAGRAFAPASTALEPTSAEALEELQRARRYRDEARLVGLALGGAAGLLLFALRRR